MRNKNESARSANAQTISYGGLESRRLLASISLNAGTLLLDGSGGNDVFRVNRIGSTMVVARVETPFETLTRTFALGSIDAVEVKGRNGDDFFNNATSLKSTFYGQGGNDRGLGGRAADTFFGGEGDDFFYGRQGIDTAYGWNGNDRLFGAQGSDTLHGQNGNDFIFGGSGDDKIFGNRGRDRLFGLDGNDNIFGGDGNDFIAGGFGDDHLAGDAGNDVIRGGDGNDELLGNEGSDLLMADDGNDTSHGGAGVDYIFDLTGGQNTIFGDAGNDALRGGTGSDEIHGGDGNDRIFGAGGNDSLYGDDGVDFIEGGSGNDGLFGGIGGRDSLNGGTGSDRFLVFVDQNSNHGQTLDSVVDADVGDAVVSFVSNLEIRTDRIYAAGTWTNAEIKIVDSAFENLHSETGDTRLLKLANGHNLTIARLGDVRTSSGSPILGLNFNNSNRIGLTNQLFADFSDRIQETVYHEVAHNFDTADENPFVPAFRAISNWDQVKHSGDRLSLDRQWYYNDEFNNFLRSYARTNPMEDFAVTFAEYFQKKFDGFQRAFVNPVEKFAVIDAFLRS